MEKSKITLFIDPSYNVFYQDRLFDINNLSINRDDMLQPFFRLKVTLNDEAIPVRTADYLYEEGSLSSENHYWSLGILKNYPELLNREGIKLKYFFMMEPPAVASHLYRALPQLTRYFERVYVHNTVGDGYSLKGVDQSRLRSFFWPQPYADVLESHWNNQDRKKRIVVINGNHIPRSFKNQLYSKRITAMASLAKLGIVDLYGRGWDKWWSHRSMWPPYWFNYKTLMSIYRGACDSKYAVLSQYSFSLCFENMVMKGYVTEKIFDCLYAGTIPLYLGAKDIESLIPPEAYIDCRQFSSWSEMGEAVMAMTDAEILKMKEAGKAFIQSDRYLNYYNSLINIFKD
jgi:hypothetical protein